MNYYSVRTPSSASFPNPFTNTKNPFPIADNFQEYKVLRNKFRVICNWNIRNLKAIATLLSLIFFIDRAGRRRLLIIGATGASLTMWYIGAYIIAAKVDPNTPEDRSVRAWVGIVCVCMYML